MAGSPLGLSDFGRQIADRLDVEVWAAGLAPAIAAEVKGKRPFEVDEFCQTYVQHRLHKDWADRIGECAYELGIERYDVLSVMRVVLRDRLLVLAGPAA